MQNAIQFVCGKKDTFTPAQDKCTGAGGKGGGGEVDKEKKKKRIGWGRY